MTSSSQDIKDVCQDTYNQQKQFIDEVSQMSDLNSKSAHKKILSLFTNCSSNDQKSIITKRNLRQFMSSDESTSSKSRDSSRSTSRGNGKSNQKIDNNNNHMKIQQYECQNIEDQYKTASEKQSIDQKSKKLYTQIYKEFQRNFSENKELQQLRAFKQGMSAPGKSRSSLSPISQNIQQFQLNQKEGENLEENQKLQNQNMKEQKLVQNQSRLRVKLRSMQLNNAQDQKQSAIALVQYGMVGINQLLERISKLILITVRHKESFQSQDFKDIKTQAQQFGIKLSSIELQNNFLKSKEFISLIRSKLLTYMNKSLLQESKHLPSATQKKQVMFKFWVECSGNNHNLLKQIIKRRNWMILANDYSPDYQIEAGENEGEEGSPQKGNDTQNKVVYPNLVWTQMRRPKLMKELRHDQIYNHLDGVNSIATKSGLFLNLKDHCEKQGIDINNYLPETYLIRVEGNNKELRQKDLNSFKQIYQKDEIWILKPGENSNRGHGIQVLNDFQQITNAIEKDYCSSHIKTVVLQKYISNPYLVFKRKFDFRVYCLLTYYEETQTLRAYYYDEGYLRTSCKEFSLNNIDSKYVHLTNDAVQKSSQDYGKFENGNKLSYEDFHKLLLKDNSVDFYQTIVPQMRECMRLVIDAAKHKLVGEIRTNYNGYEVFGFDFMLDTDMKLYLIECNTNPCLETQQSILLQRIIPQMLEQTMKIAVDPFLRASENQYLQGGQEITMNEFKYEMILEHKYGDGKK
eukprot:403351706